ncbi:hypothetical protein CLM62_41370 [Streptomyces sp. SA15]|uniref:asparagine synthase-related protein n=1 Tax=Streptomyces sp. SA15 TaxID=934019 RepID=UPI000BB08247|nr:asparagine synthase-related protein [Streptomyces sp. SA15]PAZ10331.1 hypothetical protein CLM62_41370 [Streptomyces sp. SA15]
MTPLSKWCVVGNTPIPDLAPLARSADLDGLHAYYRGPDDAVLPDGPFALDVRSLTLHQDARHEDHRSFLRVEPETVTVRVSPLNEDPVYYAVNRLRGLFVYFTDLLLAPLVLPALGRSVEITRTPPVHATDTPLLGVSRLPYGVLTRTRRRGGTWLTDASDEYDPLAGFRAPHRDDPLAAGEAQIEALTAEIERIDRATPDGTRYATLLSGGIDSGTVTYLAATSGLSVTPYSVGTPWGDELADAAELCAELGIGLEPVQLTEDQIVASIPEAVRWLGVTEPEVVEVALTATTVQRLGAIPEDRVLLTGYGSDLINAGLYRPYDHRDELIEQVLTAVDRTRYSNELSNRMPLAYGTATHHPFWSWPVMRVALETAPECKVREGREKYHLRAAMGTRLAEPIAWRRKIAVHHGGGLQQGVIRRLEKETGTEERGRFYAACFTELVLRAAGGELEPADPWSLFEAAVRRVRDGADGR